MKKITGILGCIFLLAACNSQDNSADSDEVKKVTSEVTSEFVEVPDGIHAELIPFDLNEGINKASLIAEVRILEKIKEVDEKPIPYSVFSAVVEDSYKGELISKEITIKQQGTIDWTFNDNDLFKPDEKYILFLMKTKSSEADYWILGEETGMFKVVDSDIVIKLADNNEEFESIEANSSSVLSNYSIDDGSQIIDKKKLIDKIKEMGE